MTITTDHQPFSGGNIDRSIAIVAPQWLQDGLAVVITTIPRLHLVACNGSINTLLLLDLKCSPDLVVLTVDSSESKDRNPIRQAKLVYPHAHYLALIQDSAYHTRALAEGADETLLQGASADQLCVTINRLVQFDQDGSQEKKQDD